MLVTLIKRILGGPDALSLFLQGKLAYERGELRDATRLLDSALKVDPPNAGAHLYAGLTRYRLEQYQAALEHFERAVALDPSSDEYRYQAGAAEYMLGNLENAWRHCEEALERNPHSILCHTLMSRIALPGPTYTDILAAIHQLLRPRTYVEIGVFRGASLKLAQRDTRVVGIDPIPQVPAALAPNTTVYAMKSDDYFARRDVRDDLGGLPIELAFIDGLHNFEFALRDFINLERHAAPGSTILVHDWYPLNRFTAERECKSPFFSGDVWRLMLILKKYRPELRVVTVATAPTGLGIVRGLDPASRVLERNFDAIVAEFMALDYGVLERDKPGMLNLFPNDWDKVQALLLESAARAPA